jgi:hypothetical protein
MTTEGLLAVGPLIIHFPHEVFVGGRDILDIDLYGDNRRFDAVYDARE